MASSFSQEPRSDSHKIGETRYRMSHLPSITAIARTLLLAGILLAVTVLAARSFFPVFAQEGPIEYAENSTDPVAVYTGTDPEGEDVNWNITGPDEADFSIDENGALTFDTPPNFEDPTDDSGQTLTSPPTTYMRLLSVPMTAPLVTPTRMTRRSPCLSGSWT